jgi:PST family polysaccharide transporter
VLRALSTLAFVGMGMSAGLALVGRDLIYVLLGPQWTESGRIFSFFAPAIGGLLLYFAYGWIHLSIGRPDRMFRWAVIEFAVIGCLFILGLPWGPVGVAAAWAVSAWVLAVPALWYAGRPADLGIGSIIGAVGRYVVAAPLAGAMAATIIHRIPGLSAPGLPGAIDRSLTTLLLFGVVYLCVVVVLYGGTAPLRQVGALLQDMLPRSSHHPDVPAPLVTSG